LIYITCKLNTPIPSQEGKTMRTNHFFYGCCICVIVCFISSSPIFSAAPATGEWRMVGGEPTLSKGFASLAQGGGDTLFAGGDSGVAVWTGKQWVTIASTPVYRTVYHAPFLYVIGDFVEIAGCKSRSVARRSQPGGFPRD